MATKIDPDGRLTDLAGPLDLPALNAAVGGYIEPVHLGTLRAADGTLIHTLLVVNEDGHRLGLADNPLASRIAAQRIVGPALLCCVHAPGTAAEEWR